MRIGDPGAGRPAPSPHPSGRSRPGRSFTRVLGERVDGDRGNPRLLPAAAARTPAAAPTGAAHPTPVRALLDRVAKAENGIDALVEAAARGKTFSPAELLALQAAVFRYSQTVEVVSRVADRLVGAVKQTMGTQV